MTPTCICIYGQSMQDWSLLYILKTLKRNRI
ncbi:Mt1 [Phodopus roborovskii]|uniref:Mt1 protein n=1 Tax=Phodopus roborovskii TaxID=109678 RepID=A0AAV0A0E1_PHORO|nr:Mt1 [Phodopus roborovskii]